MKALQILVVEDDTLIAMLLVETLVEMGHGVCGVEVTEADAVAAALRYRPDLIIVDAQLREGNGVSAVDEILGTAFVPHLFISGDIKKVLARRPDAVAIAKPFRESELVQAIQRALDAADLDFKDRAVGYWNK
jgi:CheY-like chemotaxis protein